MFSAVRLVARPGLDIAAVTCGQDHAGWSPPEAHPDYRVVLVRRGRFRRRVAGQAADLDPSVGYLGLPDDEEHFAHPAGGDVCTSVRLGPALWHALTGDVAPTARTAATAANARTAASARTAPPAQTAASAPSAPPARTAPAARTFYVDAHLDLAHRRLLRAARDGDVDYAVVERLVELLSSALGGTTADRHRASPPSVVAQRLAMPSGSRGVTTEGRGASGGGASGGGASGGGASGGGASAAGRDRALVDRAREAIRADHPAAGGLLPLAALLDVSPFRLSRAFTAQLGVSLTRYRNRVRVEWALDRLEQGADDLAALAADLGFTDQAHLCRTMRHHLGHPPSTVRRLLT